MARETELGYRLHNIGGPGHLWWTWDGRNTKTVVEGVFRGIRRQIRSQIWGVQENRQRGRDHADEC